MMVSPYDDSRLLVVLQIDHSRVAGLLAAHWGNAEFAEPRPYTSVVLAAQEHDSGWWDWEIKPTLDERGEPIDYFGRDGMGVPRDIHCAFDRHGIDRVAEQDPYAGLLVSMHLSGLNNQGFGVVTHMPNRMHLPTVAEFMRDQEQLRAQLLARLRQSPAFAEVSTDEHVWVNYKLMEAFDRLAQFICNRYPLNSTARRGGPPNVLHDIPVAPGKQDTTITVDVQDEKRAIVRPYPFDVDVLEVPIPARLVPRRSYPSQEEFLRDYYKAPRTTMNYSLHAA